MRRQAEEASTVVVGVSRYAHLEKKRGQDRTAGIAVQRRPRVLRCGVLGERDASFYSQPPGSTKHDFRAVSSPLKIHADVHGAVVYGQARQCRWRLGMDQQNWKTPTHF